MSGADQLAKTRAARDWAKAEFDTSLAQLRCDLEEQSIGARVKDKLLDDASAVYTEALEVASESKGLIAATVAALALWFLRHPIIAWAQQLLGEAEESDDHE